MGQLARRSAGYGSRTRRKYSEVLAGLEEARVLISLGATVQQGKHLLYIGGRGFGKPVADALRSKGLINGFYKPVTLMSEPAD